MRPLFFSLLTIAALAEGQGKRTFTGIVTDSMCATADHSHMRMGPTDAECTVACHMEHGAPYVLYDGKEVYTLSDQTTPEKFAGKKGDGHRHAGRQDQDHSRGLDQRGKINPGQAPRSAAAALVQPRVDPAHASQIRAGSLDLREVLGVAGEVDALGCVIGRDALLA